MIKEFIRHKKGGKMSGAKEEILRGLNVIKGYSMIAVGNVSLIAAYLLVTAIPAIWIWNLVMPNFDFMKITMRVSFFQSMLILLLALIIARFVKFNPHPLFDE